MPSAKEVALKQWKPQLKALGFVYRNGMFWYKPDEPLQLGVAIQRHKAEPTYRINTAILMRNPLLAPRFSRAHLLNAMAAGFRGEHWSSSWLARRPRS